jgi:hypothetical protein
LVAAYLANLPAGEDDDNPIAAVEKDLARVYADLMAQPWVERALTVLVVPRPDGLLPCREAVFRHRFTPTLWQGRALC